MAARISRVAWLVALLVGLVATPIGARTVAADDPCAGHWCVQIAPFGNGTGGIVEDARIHNNDTLVEDHTIICERQGGVTSGTCIEVFPLAKTSSDRWHIFVQITSDSASHLCTASYDCTLPRPYDAELVFSPTSGPDSEYGFVLISARNLSVTKAGAGSGTVSSYPPGILCGSKCSADFDSQSTVTLTAQAAAGSHFAGWSGYSGSGCSGTGTCLVSMATAVSVTATFALNAVPTSSPTVATPRPSASAPPSASPTRTPATGGGAGTTAPPPAALASPEPGQSAEATSTLPGDASLPPLASGAVAAAGAGTTQEPAAVAPTGASPGVDLTPIALAIVVAGLAIGAGIALSGRRRRASLPPDGGS
jgi:hypothetical protein